MEIDEQWDDEWLMFHDTFPEEHLEGMLAYYRKDPVRREKMIKLYKPADGWPTEEAA